MPRKSLIFLLPALALLCTQCSEKNEQPELSEEPKQTKQTEKTTEPTTALTPPTTPEASTPETPAPEKTAPPLDPEKLRLTIARGKHLYNQGEYCGKCHMENGEGVPENFPPLDGSKWATSDKMLLTKIALHGVHGEMTVKGQTYNKIMPGYAYRSDHQELADILTYVRNAWSNKCGDIITKEEIDQLFKQTEGKQYGMYEIDELLKAHPLKK